MPQAIRGASAISPDSGINATALPRRPPRAAGPAAMPEPVFSTTSVFHSPQESHLPAQREDAAPQFWQTKEERDFATDHISMFAICSMSAHCK